MKRITRDIMPCWYELSWKEKEPAILLRVHRDFIANIKTVPSSNPFANRFLAEFKFKKFTAVLRKFWL